MCQIDDIVEHALEKNKIQNKWLVELSQKTIKMEHLDTDVPDVFRDIPMSIIEKGRMRVMDLEDADDVKIIKMLPGSETALHKHKFLESFTVVSGKVTYVIYENETSKEIIAKGTVQFGDPPIVIARNKWHIIVSSPEVSYFVLKIS